MSETNVYKKWLKVMESADYVQKKGRNDFHKYNYVTEADLLDAVRPAMIEQGLVMFPENVEMLAQHNSTITIRFTYRVVDTETRESFTISTIAQGSDSADKGAYKASTGASKYIMMKSLLIATGDDPEEDRDSVNVKNENATVVIRALGSIGFEWQDARLVEAVGERLDRVPNSVQGSNILRLVYTFAGKLKNDPDKEDELLEKLKEAIAGNKTTL